MKRFKLLYKLDGCPHGAFQSFTIVQQEVQITGLDLFYMLKIYETSLAAQDKIFPQLRFHFRQGMGDGKQLFGSVNENPNPLAMLGRME